MSEPRARKSTKETPPATKKAAASKKAAAPKKAATEAAPRRRKPKAQAVEAVVEAAQAQAPAPAEKAVKPKRVKAAPAAANGAAEEKVKRPKKEKVVRDSFSMPKSDYEKIAALKQKCLDAGVSVKKSEILRAGLLMLAAAAPNRLLMAVSSVEAVKTGRPAKS